MHPDEDVDIQRESSDALRLEADDFSEDFLAALYIPEPTKPSASTNFVTAEPSTVHSHHISNPHPFARDRNTLAMIPSHPSKAEASLINFSTVHDIHNAPLSSQPATRGAKFYGTLIDTGAQLLVVGFPKVSHT